VRHALEVGARRVVVLSRDELKQHEMAHALNDARLRFFIGNVIDRNRVVLAMRGVDLVVHAAALKQIPTCEDNPWEAVATNVEGTQNVASAAIEAGVERAVFLSTDKAASPNTHYGACKLAAERLWVRSNTYAAGTKTKLVATRYGNVIGSRGSVIPFFQRQAEAGGPLTVTDPAMTRFWMRLSDAVALVELALSEGDGGEVFIPKVQAADILTVAEAVAPGMDYTVTGIRRGEKLHEMLITEDEARDTWEYETHYRILPGQRSNLPPTFRLRSDTAPQLSVSEMRELIEEE